MKTQLKNGRIPTPASVQAAAVRRDLLLEEVRLIAEQLSDTARAMRMSGEAYGAWRRSAVAAQQLFTEEARQLFRWLTDQRERFELKGIALLRQAAAVLRGLELRYPFTEYEQSVADLVDDYCGSASATEGAERTTG